jgi:hypothetical protein
VCIEAKTEESKPSRSKSASQQEANSSTQFTRGGAASAAFKAHIAEVAKTNKALAAQLKGDRFKVAKFEQAGFRTPEEAIHLRETVDEYGGLEGLEQLATDAREFAEEIGMLSEGNPALLEKLSQSSPDGVAKLVVPA